MDYLATALVTPFRDTKDCFRWLYSLGSQPMSLEGEYLSSVTTPAQRACFSTCFERMITDGWESWVRDDLETPPRYKVYVNTHDRSVSAALSILAKPLLKTDGFKLVSKGWMSHRPDHLIAYFKTPDRRQIWCSENIAMLSSFSAAHVPFTHPFAGCAAVSCADDPLGKINQSWRSVFITALAEAVLRNHGDPSMASTIAHEITAKFVRNYDEPANA